MKLRTLSLVTIILFSLPLSASDASLEQRITELEKRIVSLEELINSPIETQKLKLVQTAGQGGLELEGLITNTRQANLIITSRLRTASRTITKKASSSLKPISHFTTCLENSYTS